MDQVNAAKHDSTEHLLDLPIAAWEDLPQVAEDSHEWDFDSQISYLADWGAQEELLLALERRFERGKMDARQAARYERLRRTVRDMRPVLARLAKCGLPNISARE